MSLETKDNSESVKSFGKRLAMHVAASNPLALSSDLIDKDVLTKRTRYCSGGVKEVLVNQKRLHKKLV